MVLKNFRHFQFAVAAGDTTTTLSPTLCSTGSVRWAIVVEILPAADVGILRLVNELVFPISSFLVLSKNLERSSPGPTLSRGNVCSY